MKTCSELYKQARFLAYNGKFKQAVDMGFLIGLTEKVYLGACHASMTLGDHDLACFAEQLVEIYGLRFHVFQNSGRMEIWIYNSLAGLTWLNHPVNSPEYHRLRATACGIPEHKIDEKWHENYKTS